MELDELTKPYLEICDNCHKEIVAFKSDDALVQELLALFAVLLLFRSN